jgi:hypothetical protein
MSNVTTFIGKQLITSNWTRFERLEVGEYGASDDYNMFEFGSFTSATDVQALLTALYVTNSTANITR